MTPVDSSCHTAALIADFGVPGLAGLCDGLDFLILDTEDFVGTIMAAAAPSIHALIVACQLFPCGEFPSGILSAAILGALH